MKQYLNAKRNTCNHLTVKLVDHFFYSCQCQECGKNLFSVPTHFYFEVVVIKNNQPKKR